MTLKKVLKNTFAQLDKYQLIFLESISTHDNLPTTYIIVMEFFNEIIRLRFDDENFNIINSFYLYSPKRAEEKMKWVLKTKALKIVSIAYVFKNEYEDTNIFAFNNEGILSYSFYSVKDKNSVSFNYQKHIANVKVDELIKDYKVFIDMLYNEKPKRIVRIINDPIKDFRMKKLMDLGID